MRKFLLALCLAYLTALINTANVKAPRCIRVRSNNSGVLLLDKSNIFRAIDDNQPILVMFYAPWCMYSKAAQPEFDIAARELRRLGVKIRLAKIDADKDMEVQKPFNIKGFPTILLFLKGTKVMSMPYEYDRKAVNIIQWLREWIRF